MEGTVQPADVSAGSTGVQEAQVDLDRDVFLRSLVRELAGVLERTVGLDDAAGYISVVGQGIGDWIDRSYREALGSPSLDHDQVRQVLADLKARIGGGFELESDDGATLAYRNHTCPFEDKVVGRTSMCMMTSNVFGVIAASNLGYAKVELAETIARGATHCSVLVHLDEGRAEQVDGREYFGD